jgi:hypothetical protein
MKTISKILTVTGVLFILSGGGSYALLSMVYMEHEHLAIPVAVVLAAVGALVLIINAVIYPESIPRPDVRPPEIHINLPRGIGGHQKSQSTNTEMQGEK